MTWMRPPDWRSASELLEGRETPAELVFAEDREAGEALDRWLDCSDQLPGFASVVRSRR